MLAEKDESALTYPLPDHVYGFLAQQSWEKLLKALLATHGVSYPFTHKLGQLTDLLASVNETIPDLPYDLLLLYPFAVEHRYDVSDELDGSERNAMRETVAILREHVVARVLALERIAES